MTTTKPTTELAVLKTDTRGRVRTPAAQRDALLDAYDQSGMSAAAFARLHGIKYPTFASWRQKRNRNQHSESPPPSDPGAFFEEVHFGPTEAAGLTVALPGGASVQVERANQFPAVAALLKYLEHAC
jgi:transposase-like protein